MSNRVFIVHGWGGNPEEGWFPWLKGKLEDCGVEVIVLSMPDPENPKTSEWVPFLYEKAGNPNEHTYFIGHSIGCQTIMRYLEKINSKIGGAIFVAGWFHLKGLSKEEEKVAEPWLENDMNFEKINQNLNKLTVLLSSNDPYVDPVINGQMFKVILEAKVVEEKNKGHYSGEDKITEIPALLEECKKMLNVSPVGSRAVEEGANYELG